MNEGKALSLMAFIVMLHNECKATDDQIVHILINNEHLTYKEACFAVNVALTFPPTGLIVKD